jgi:hypothetical protein
MSSIAISFLFLMRRNFKLFIKLDIYRYLGWLQVVVCKDAGGKVGMRVKAVNKGIFVCLVIKDSPAALAGLRYGSTQY